MAGVVRAENVSSLFAWVDVFAAQYALWRRVKVALVLDRRAWCADRAAFDERARRGIAPSLRALRAETRLTVYRAHTSLVIFAAGKLAPLQRRASGMA